MAITLDFKDIIDLPEWRPLAVAPWADTAGKSLAFDLRNNEDRHPEIFCLASATALGSYGVKSDGWALLGSPALGGTFGAGAASVFAPQRGPRGALAAGSTPTSVVLNTALPAAVGSNQLADRGDGKGFKVRIVGNSTGSSGRTEERYVTASTSGTTPTLTLDAPLSFTPVAGDAYEFLSGRVYLLGAGTVAAGTWKFYDILTNSFSGSLSTSGLTTSILTDSCFVCLDELYVPANRKPGEGYFGSLAATGSSATSLTGQAAGGDSGLLANEFRNFQIRIVEDSGNPRSVGQRRKVISHTAGPSPVYTVTAWTMNPSPSAVYVIENSNEILLWSSASTSTYTYAQDAVVGGQAGDTWSTSTYAARPSAAGAGVMAFHGFGLSSLDSGKNARYSYLYSFRGGNVNTLDLFDLAGAASGSWTAGIAYSGLTSTGSTFTTGSSGAYDPATNGGAYAYVCLNGTNTFFRLNLLTRNLQKWTQFRFTQGTAYVGQKMAFSLATDGDTKIGFVYAMRAGGVELFHCLLQR